MLPDLVSATQSAFVEERLITDNILIAHEIVHALRTNDNFSKDFMLSNPICPRPTIRLSGII